MSLSGAPSYVMHQDRVDLLIADSQVLHCGGRIGMIEPFGKDLDADSVVLPLDVPERFPERVGPKVSVQVDGSAPFLNHTIQALHLYGLVFAFPGFKKKFLFQ